MPLLSNRINTYMKIVEIIEPRERTQVFPHDWDHEALKQKHNAALGLGQNYNPNPSAGFYSQGYEVRDPFMYGKVAHLPTDLRQDGFYQYAQAIKPIMDSNPYVPRIYGIKLMKDRSGQIRPDYRMEKLVHGQTLNSGILHAVGARTLGSEEWHKCYAQRLVNIGIKYLEEMDNIDVWRHLCYIVREIIQAWPRVPQTEVPLDIDPALTQVAKLIKMAEIKNHAIKLDLHANNIMVRPGSAPHLVISDPLDTLDTAQDSSPL